MTSAKNWPILFKKKTTGKPETWQVIVKESFELEGKFLVMTTVGELGGRLYTAGTMKDTYEEAELFAQGLYDCQLASDFQLEVTPR